MVRHKDHFILLIAYQRQNRARRVLSKNKGQCPLEALVVDGSVLAIEIPLAEIENLTIQTVEVELVGDSP